MITTDATATLDPNGNSRTTNQSQLVIEFNGIDESDFETITSGSGLSNMPSVLEYLVLKLSTFTLKLSTGSPSSNSCNDTATLSVTNPPPCLTSTSTLSEIFIGTGPIPSASIISKTTSEDSKPIDTSSPTSASSFLHCHTSSTDVDSHLTFTLSSTTKMPTITIATDQASLSNSFLTVPTTPVTILSTSDSVMSVISNTSSQPPSPIINEPANLSQFEKDSLATHNIYRSFHGAEPLEWNVILADFAQYHLSVENCTFENSHGPFGEHEHRIFFVTICH